jgi:transcriptional regulator with XRE-family HTH domain
MEKPHIGLRIKGLVKKSGKTAEQIAVDSGIGKKYLFEIYEQQSPTFKILEKIAPILGYSVDQLMSQEFSENISNLHLPEKTDIVLELMKDKEFLKGQILQKDIEINRLLSILENLYDKEETQDKFDSLS